MKNELNNISIQLFEGSTSSFDKLKLIEKQVKQLNNLSINIKISVARLGEAGNEMSEIGNIFSDSLKLINTELRELEGSTKAVRDLSKDIRDLIKEE